MKTLYLECNMGAAGDMLMAALLELHNDGEDFLRRLNGLNLPEVIIKRQRAAKCGINGTQVVVTVGGVSEGGEDHHHAHDAAHGHQHEHEHDQHHHTHSEHHHASLGDIAALIGNLAVPEAVKANALAVYQLIAEAESKAHGRPVNEVHFHEVGALDAVADIVGVCWLLDELAVEEIIASPIHVGAGTVHCAHGILPVPAPATADILRGVPIYGGAVQGELCTPTGAALLKHFAHRFGPMPMMTVEKIGYGMGSKDFPEANCLRAMLGETAEQTEEVWLLACNLDDMTPEEIAFATEVLWETGALDVFTSAIQMKKNRPGVLLSCLCDNAHKEKLTAAIFKHTTTLGLRQMACARATLSRHMESKQTAWGEVRIKHAQGLGLNRAKAEYEDLAEIARKNNLSLLEVKAALAREVE